jgi:hypothetical protein
MTKSFVPHSRNALCAIIWSCFIVFVCLCICSMLCYFRLPRTTRGPVYKQSHVSYLYNNLTIVHDMYINVLVLYSPILLLILMDMNCTNTLLWSNFLKTFIFSSVCYIFYMLLVTSKYGITVATVLQEQFGTCNDHLNVTLYTLSDSWITDILRI